MRFSRKAESALFHLVLVDKFKILSVVDGVDGEQRCVVRYRDGVGTGAERQVDVDEVETKPLLPDFLGRLGVGGNFVGRMTAGHEAGAALQAVLV